MNRRAASSRWRLRLALIGVLFLGLLVGWLIGYDGGTPQAETSSAGARVAGSRTRAGVPVGFPRTPQGAAAAAAAYQRAFASPSILRAGVLRERIEAVATPGYVARMLAVNSPGSERLAAGAIGAGLVQGTQTLYTAVPIGYEVESFSPQQAQILIWGFTLLGNATAVEPAAYFGLSHTELVWSEDGWRIAATRARFGPTPRLSTAPGPLGGYGVLNLARHLESYALAP